MHCYLLNIEAEVAGHNVHFDSLRPSQQLFSYVWMGLPKQRIKCLVQHRASSEPATPYPESSSLPLSHCAP